MIYFLILFLLIYVIYTLNFAIQLNKTRTIFNDKQNLVHNILIWVIPFFWVMIVKAMMKPTPGSDKFKKTKPTADFRESEIGIWGHHNESQHTDSGHGHSNDD